VGAVKASLTKTQLQAAWAEGRAVASEDVFDAAIATLGEQFIET
jgi:hypothetical protein